MEKGEKMSNRIGDCGIKGLAPVTGCRNR